MNNLDSIQRFIFENADIRGQIVRIDASFQAIIEKHQYSEQISRLLGETLIATALLTSIIKFKGELTLQFRSEGAVSMLVSKCSHDYKLRGLVQYDPTASDESIAHEIGRGNLVVTIQPYDKVSPYQSIIPVNQLSIAKCLEKYFAQSEQLSTRLVFASSPTRAAGMLLQLMPESSKASSNREEFWEHAVKIGETITPEELLELDNQDILYRLYHGEDIRLFDAEPVVFECNCSQQKMQEAVKTLGHQDALDLLKQKQQIVVTCEYCNEEYTFDKVDIEALFH